MMQLQPRQIPSGRPVRGAGLPPRGLALGVMPEAPPRARQRQGRLFKSPPTITYTVSKREVTPEDLLQLYTLCACGDDEGGGGGETQRGSRTRRSYWHHWTQMPEDRVLEKLRIALNSSVAIAAAFTRDPRLTPPARWPAPGLGLSSGDDNDDYERSGGSGSGDSASSSSSGLWGSGIRLGLGLGGSASSSGRFSGASSSGREVAGRGAGGGSGDGEAPADAAAVPPWQAPLLQQLGSGLWGPRRKNCLVGFARAAGDYSLVATVHDVAIHPELQGLGIGARLVKKVVTQVSSCEVYDIGLVAPRELQPFFHGCGFDLDREKSVPMALPGGLAGGGAAESARVAANEQLKRLLRGM